MPARSSILLVLTLFTLAGCHPRYALRMRQTGDPTKLANATTTSDGLLRITLLKASAWPYGGDSIPPPGTLQYRIATAGDRAVTLRENGVRFFYLRGEELPSDREDLSYDWGKRADASWFFVPKLPQTTLEHSGVVSAELPLRQLPNWMQIKYVVDGSDKAESIRLVAEYLYSDPQLFPHYPTEEEQKRDEALIAAHSP